MTLSELEKKERHRQAVQRYRSRQRKKIQEGDKKAISQANKNKYSTFKSHAIYFIKIANKKDLLLLRDKIAERQKKKK